MEVTLTAASYRWRCPECGQEHFVSCITHYVSCSDCGCICRVAGTEHRSQVDEGEPAHRVAAQAALF
jgi:hypothetical protein